jgi:phage/plasmid primase-like uncharacterized protein
MTAHDDWIDQARCVPTVDVLRERGILETVKGRNGRLTGPCPNCGGEDRFGVNIKKGRGGLFHCRGCGCGGTDAISLVCFLDRCGFLCAVETLVGPPPGKRETAEERDTREQRAIERREKSKIEQRKRQQREAEEIRQQHQKAAWLWSRRQEISGTIAEVYLREARRIRCKLPPTLGFLPPLRREHHPAMIAAFAIPDECEPGVLAEPCNIDSVHLTLLNPDGTAKAVVERQKIVVGSPGSLPIIIATPNDLLGLAITEGIEDALTAHQATGLGAWAAGSANRLPALAEVIPEYIEVLTIYAHADENGRGQDSARALATTLRNRGVEVVIEGI